MLQTVNTIKELLFLVTRSVPQQYVVNILYLGGKYICKQHTAPHVTMDATEALVYCHIHSVIFPRGVVHRVGNGRGLTKVAVVLLNGLLW